MKPQPNKEKQRYDFGVKVVIIGQSSVGKTSILSRFSSDQFKPNQISTIGVDFKIKTLEIKEIKIKMQIWDTAGQQRFRNIPSTYYKGAAGVIFVYSINDRSSFNNLEFWFNQISGYTQKLSTILVGNKSDLPNRQVSAQQGRKMADRMNTKFIESSAKDSHNVQQIFSILGEDMRNRLIEQQYVARNSHKLVHNGDSSFSCRC